MQGNNDEFITQQGNFIHHQDENEMLELRRHILKTINQLLCNKSKRDDVSKYYSLAQRLEILLYYQAYSIQEYTNEATLERRIFALNIKSRSDRLKEDENEAYQLSVVQRQSNNGLNVNVTCSDNNFHAMESQWLSNPLLFNGNMQVVEHVLSFLTLKEVILCSLTSKLAYNLYSGKAAHIFLSYPNDSQFQLANLCTYPNVEQIIIHGEEVASSDVASKFGSATYVISRNVYCRQLLEVLQHMSQTSLVCVELECLYIDGGDDTITKSLMSTLLDADRFPKLETLSLKGNYIGDDGPEYLANLLHSNYPKASNGKKLSLKKLDLCNNYIGERGKYFLNNISNEYTFEILY